MTEITYDELKQRLKTDQRLAAELIVANDFAPKGEKRSLDEIGIEVGITSRQLYNWRQNSDFTRYMAAISDNKLENYRSLADSQLINLIKGTHSNGVGALRALELFYRLNNRLVERTVVTNEANRAPSITRDQISEGLEDLQKLVQ